MKPVRLTDEAYAALTSWTGRLQRIQGRRVYFSEALLEAVRLADAHENEDIATISKEQRM